MNKLSQLDPSIERLPSNIRNFLKKFYNLLDGESSKAAKEWSEMFRENGQFICASKTQTGRKDIGAHREAFWQAFPGLKHKPKRLYALPESWLAIAVVTEFTLERRNIPRIASHAVAEFRLSEVDGDIQIDVLELFMETKSLTSAA